VFELLADLTDDDCAQAEKEDFESLEDWLGEIEVQVLFEEPPAMPLDELQAESHRPTEIFLIQLPTKYIHRYTAKKRTAWTLWY